MSVHDKRNTPTNWKIFEEMILVKKLKIKDWRKEIMLVVFRSVSMSNGSYFEATVFWRIQHPILWRKLFTLSFGELFSWPCFLSKTIRKEVCQIRDASSVFGKDILECMFHRGDCVLQNSVPYFVANFLHPLQWRRIFGTLCFTNQN